MLRWRTRYRHHYRASLTTDQTPSPARLRRLVEELAEAGVGLGGDEDWRAMLLQELDYALRPHVHERRIPSFGAVIEPSVDESGWAESTQLTITHRSLEQTPGSVARRFADGLSSWLVRSRHADELIVFDRPAGSERDLVVLASSFGATVVQRHPTGSVRLAGSFGVLRWDGLTWHHEPPLSAWIDTVGAAPEHGDRRVLKTLLEFAVHDLGSRGIGALLVYRPDGDEGPAFETRLPTPPRLQINRPSDLAPLRHALGQLDGAAVFDANGALRHLGVRLVPSPEAESDVEGYRGMRHTSGRRYSFDDERATVIVVSEDGPVTVLRAGQVLGSSGPGR